MGRKPGTRTASAAAAAASVGDVSTFTSFAAATAQALQEHSSASTTPAGQHEWDSTALQLLKKLSKRDATTKEKALMDISEHLKTLPSDSGVGSTFIAAWGESFRAAVQDSSPAVRIAALKLMADTVQAFRRAIQHIFPSILPLWLSAHGDLNTSVSETATSSLERVLPTEGHRKKVFSRYAKELKTYCDETISRIGSSESFLADAKRVIAILRWLLSASQEVSSISSIVDAEPHPLLLFAKGRKKKRESESALRDVCELAMFILSFMTRNRTEDDARAAQFADIAVHAIRKTETSGWDLTIVLLRDGWSSSFGPRLEKLSSVVCESVASPVPTGVHALLPLFESLPHEQVSSSFAEKVLSSMREYLHPSKKGTKRVQITVSYALTALLAYIQTASYSQRVLAARWFGDDEGKANAFAGRIFAEHVVPTCRHFVSGILPPISESISSRRRSTSAGSDKNITEISQAFGHVLRVMDDVVSSQVIFDIADGFGSSLSEHTPDERLRRFEYLVDVIGNEAREKQLVEAGIVAIVNNKAIKPEVAGTVLATLLSSKPGRRLAISKNVNTNDGSTLLSNTYEYCVSLIKQANENNEGDSSISWMKIAKILSWIYTSSACLDGGQTWSMLVTKIRLMCSKETEHNLMTEVILAQKQERETFEDMGWIPFMGRYLDATVVEIMNELKEHELSESAVRFACTALDVEGGARLSKESWKNVILIITEALRKDEKNEQRDPLIEAVISSFSSELRFNDIDRDLVSISMFRAVQNRAILEQVTAFIEAYPSEKLSILLESIGRALLRYLLEVEESSQLSQLAYSVSAIVSAFGAHGVTASSLLCTRLLAHATPGFITELLRQTPFTLVFGDGVAQRANVQFFNEMIGKACTKPHEEVDIGLRKYLAELDVGERLRIGQGTTRLLLSNSQNGSQKIVCFLSEVTTGSSSEEFTAISDELKRFWLDETQSEASASRDLSGIPVVVQICSVRSRGKLIESFRSFLEYILSASLEEEIKKEAVWAIETIAASLSGFVPSNHREAELQPPSWLRLVALKALQIGPGRLSSIPEIERRNGLEASLANLFRVSLLCLKFEAQLNHGLTHWASRICTVFQSFASKHCGDLSWSDAQRLCFLIGLALVIVIESEKGILDCELGDELCYWGAWISVSPIPLLEKNIRRSIGTVDAFTCSQWCGDLIMFAAERGTLLRGDEEMPIPVDNVYSLILSLTSSSAVIRRAILTIVLHVATVDLSYRVLNAFPEEGFASENDERSFVADIIPSQLRDALKWTIAPNAQSENHEDIISYEIGYLLAWRIFLDLMKPDDSLRSSSSATDTGDVSFRRVGLLFLEAHPRLYKDFFKRCVDIVIEGSTEELQSARRAAVMAIQTEENAASGVIVAKSGQSVGTERLTLGDSAQDGLRNDNSEAAVGHAAGIAFARALQRLPALSREIVTHELERGAALRVEAFVRANLTPLLIATEVRKVKEWGSDAEGMAGKDDEGELSARGSVAGREVWATYRFSDVTLEIGMRIPDVFPLQTAAVEARSKIGMSEAQWRKTLLGMATLLHTKNCSLAEALALWQRNLDKAFQGFQECPICYSVLHVITAALPKKVCRTCKNSYHSDCLLRWFSTSNTSSCPTCRSAFYVRKGGF